MKTIGLLLCLLSIFSSNFCHAQKRQPQYIAHYHSENLKAGWSDWQEMEVQVKEYSDSLKQALVRAEEDFMDRIKAFQKRTEYGDPSRKEIEEQVKKFQAEEKQLLQQQAEIDSQFLVRREPLEENLQEKLNNALQLVAEEKGYTYILDATTISMHINGGEDLTALLRERLEE